MLKREFKINLKSFLIWSSIVVAMLITVFAVYPSLINDATAMDQLMSSMPKEMLEIFNMDIVSLNSVFGWLATEGYLIIILLGGCYSAILGGTILLKEEDEGTVEFLYSKPISRNKIIIQKIFVAIVYILLFNLLIAITNLVGLKLSNDLDLMKWLLISLMPLLINYLFFFASLFISTWLTKTRTSIGINLGVIFITYLLSILSNLSDKLKFLKYLSPFEYVNARKIITDSSIDYIYVIISLALIILFTSLTFIKYNKKEF